MEVKELLKQFCLVPAPAGEESEIYALCRELMSAFGTCSTDKRGNFICRKEGTGTHYLLDAHMDQIGYAVTAIEEGGFLKLGKVGGVDRRCALSGEVTVLAKQPLFGVIACKPPHLTQESEKDKAPKLEELSVDTGLERAELEKAVCLGDRVVARAHFSEMLGGKVTATAIDDRAGMAIITRVMQLLQESNSSAQVTAVFSVQEEVGGQGAGNASYAADAEEAIVVDVSFAAQPEVDSAHQNQTMPLGGGAFIGFAPILDKDMSAAFVHTAKKHGIPYREEVMGGRTGTNADCIATAKTGTKTGMISPPIRNMHTAVEVANTEDLEHCARLIAAYITDKEETR